MVGPAMDCLNNPLGAVRTLFEKACAQSASIADLRSDWGAKELFDVYLHQQGGCKQVPEINSAPLSEIPNKSLVRFRGMVQDMFDVEYYLGAYKDGMTWRTTKFSDATDLPIHEKSETQVWDRRVLYCVPVPGESNWVKEAFASSSLRRATANSNNTTLITNHSEKRPRETEDSNDVEMDLRSDEESTESKRLKEETSTSVGNTTHALDLNMPLGESTLVPCIVKVYDGADSDIKLNDIVEFTGVLTFDPELSMASFSCGSVAPDSSSSPFMEENLCSRLPASRVPRLHSITYRKVSFLKILETFPSTEQMDLGLMSCMLESGCLTSISSKFHFSSVNKPQGRVYSLFFKCYSMGALDRHLCPAATPEALRKSRDSILKGLAKVLGGDHLAAEYLLLHLLSQVHHRVDSMALGKFSLNIVIGSMTSDDSSSPLAIGLAKAIQSLLPSSHLMPLSLHNLNKGLMAPRKDYTINRLVTGPLQLAEGTYLTLDETALSTGQLTSIGIQNVQSLKHLMEWQKVEYDFEFYKLEMPTDIPVLIISHARSRLLPADIVVPIRPTADSSLFSVEDSDISDWRLFLSSVRNMGHSLEPSMQKLVEDELVDARQRDRSLTPETFHRWLTLARLLSLSHGETTLSLERWRRVQEMERLCAERLRC